MILNKVKEIMMENLSIEEESITLESTFESLEIDSLDVFQLVMEVEEAFEIQIENPENMKTIKDLVNYIEEKTKVNA
ncbi:MULTISPECIES: acyl carrier protein [Romboutsia]|jgi:acyl carrier protein|uniref:Acyl carrier protein n=1 Tax=Romboutsia ilealis TaxID=1115758 RepID=A0A1V1I0E4_9FIRM|nr:MULTISPECIES: acyl carrier protein [Romboutsia]MCI9061183.1 acyl carrier protein [Romboutsia sp.]MCI9259410.1 acyl carrier protein [Romboutsia sp.]CED93712.1 Acyl carrier protein [Romboutsia ilealis]